jgi:large subunit ribosomal protein L3
MKSILGKKIGMTQIFSENGNAQAVTVVECGPCQVLQRKTTAQDGYSAIQLGFLDKKKSSKPEVGHAKKSGLEKAKKHLKEVIVSEDLQVEAGDIISTAVFNVGEDISVTGTSIGKGFQGAIKRHRFTIGPKSHGSKNHRITGTQGAMDRGGRIPLGQKKPGHMGMDQVTISGLKIINIITEQNVILVSGAIPGPKNGLVVITNRQAEYDAGKFTKETKKTEVAA